MLCFAKRFTMVTYGIGIGYVRCPWKALVKHHSIFRKKKRKNIKPTTAYPKSQKPKFGFKEF
jgi:hypothetical protein